jgi:MATE family multidrug resistance protein
MTQSHAGIAAGAIVPAQQGLWRRELGETVRLSLPIALTQLGQIAMMTTDLALVGRLGDAAVAAAALASVVLFGTFVLGMGLVTAVAPLASQGVGARKPRLVRRALRVGLWAATFAGIPLTLLQLYGEPMLLAVGQAPETAALAQRYLWGLAWSLVPGWWFMALRNFMGAVNRPEPALWIMLAAIPVNGLLAYALIFGAFGMPELDLLGAGIATTIVNLAMCAAAVWVCYAQHPFKKYRVLGRLWRSDWPLFRRLMIVGAPISGMFLLEYGVFAGAALLMGWIGTAALAAHQIALQTAAILFMVPFGISMAATVRVGQAVGRVDAAATRRAGFTALALGAGFMAAMTGLVIATRDVIPILFLGSAAVEAADTVELVSTLLVVGACFFVFDGVQTIGTGALRGLNDTRVPFVFAAFSFWGVGFVSAYALGFPFGFGAVGIWIGLTLGLFVFAVLLLWRFHLLTARGYLPEVPAADYAEPAPDMKDVDGAISAPALRGREAV